MNNNKQRAWRQAITVQFQILIQNFLGGWGKENSQDFKCPGQDSNCEPPEYKFNNEVWFQTIKQMNILNKCFADNPRLINKVITCWLRLVCGMLQKQ